MLCRLRFSVATGVILAMGTASVVLACDKAKISAASTSSSRTCTAEMAAKCTPAQAAACRANQASMTAASTSGCASKSSTAMMTANARGSCASARATMMTADAKGSCAGHDGKVSAMAAGGYSCGGKGMSGATAHRMNHADCDACAGLADCDGELKSSGALTQVVRLKNGIMYVYTVQEPNKVRTVQAAVAQRYQRLQALQALGDKAKLCPECKTMRGAIASGKLTREMVTIEGGCMALVTSTDRTIVNKLHAMIEPVAGRVKI